MRIATSGFSAASFSCRVVKDMESHRSKGRQTVSTPTISRAISSSRSSRRAMSQQHSISGNMSVSWRANSRPRPEDAPVMMAVFIGLSPSQRFSGSG